MANTIKVKRKARPELDDEPIKITSTAEDDGGEVEMVHLFSIDDRDFYAPTVMSFHHQLKAMDIQAERGEAAALSYVLRKVLGDDGYDALLSFDGLSKKNYDAIVMKAHKILNSEAGKAR